MADSARLVGGGGVTETAAEAAAREKSITDVPWASLTRDEQVERMALVLVAELAGKAAPLTFDDLKDVARAAIAALVEAAPVDEGQ